MRLVIALSVFATILVAGPTSPAGATAYLGSGQILWAGQQRVDSTGWIKAAMQGDGNFVLYHNNRAVWATGTTSYSGAYVEMQGDGNLVVYGCTTCPALWWSGTNGYYGAYLAIQHDGNMVIYTSGGSPIWATGTNYPQSNLTGVRTHTTDYLSAAFVTCDTDPNHCIPSYYNWRMQNSTDFHKRCVRWDCLDYYYAVNRDRYYLTVYNGNAGGNPYQIGMYDYSKHYDYNNFIADRHFNQSDNCVYSSNDVVMCKRWAPAFGSYKPASFSFGVSGHGQIWSNVPNTVTYGGVYSYNSHDTPFI